MRSGWIDIEQQHYFDGRAAAAGASAVDRVEAGRERAVILIRGTGHGEWADIGSPFRRLVLEPAGVVVAATVFGPERLFFPRADWREIGGQLAALLEQGTFHVLAHSHGLQPAAIAVAQASAASLVSVSGPIRLELRETYLTAAARCERVLQLADAGTDATQIAGQVFGRTAATLLGLRSRDYPAAPNVSNVREAGWGHSGLLYEVRCFDDARRLIVPAFRGETVAA